MGGAVAVLAAEKAVGRPEAASLAGVVLLAPALWDVGLVGRGSAHFLAALSPDGAVSGRELPVHVVATDNPAALRRLYFDPLTLHVTRFRALRGLVDLMRQAAVATGRLPMPALVVYGDRDQLVPPKAMAEAWRRFPPDVRRDLIPGGHHLLLRDRRGRIVADDILSWLSAPNDPLPSGGDLSAGVWAAENAARPGDAPASEVRPFPLLPAQLDRMTPK
jgi:pimeloyl-ACP methyl ester carboxylesterase